MYIDALCSVMNVQFFARLPRWHSSLCPHGLTTALPPARHARTDKGYLSAAEMKRVLSDLGEVRRAACVCVLACDDCGAVVSPLALRVLCRSFFHPCFRYFSFPPDGVAARGVRVDSRIRWSRWQHLVRASGEQLVHLRLVNVTSPHTTARVARARTHTAAAPHAPPLRRVRRARGAGRK